MCSTDVLKGKYVIDSLTCCLLNGNLCLLMSRRKMLGSYVDDLSSAIRKKMELQGSSKIIDRLQSVLAGLVALAIGQRDLVTGTYSVKK